MNNKHFTIITFYQFKKDFDQNKLLLELSDGCKFDKIYEEWVGGLSRL